MNTNLDILDRLEGRGSIYDLILQQAERAHAVMGSSVAVLGVGAVSAVQIVLEQTATGDMEREQPPAESPEGEPPGDAG